jgi:hypothetical protein
MAVARHLNGGGIDALREGYKDLALLQYAPHLIDQLDEEKMIPEGDPAEECHALWFHEAPLLRNRERLLPETLHGKGDPHLRDLDPRDKIRLQVHGQVGFNAGTSHADRKETRPEPARVLKSHSAESTANPQRVENIAAAQSVHPTHRLTLPRPGGGDYGSTSSGRTTNVSPKIRWAPSQVAISTWYAPGVSGPPASHCPPAT